MKSIYTLFLIALAALSFQASAQTYVYDDAGRLEKVLYPNGKGVAYTYDVRDNLTRVSPISVPRAVENLRIAALSLAQAKLTWEHNGVGFVFLVQSQVVGTTDWINGGSLAITSRSATVALPFGQEVRFRVLVIGDALGVQSVPSTAVQLPSTIPLLVTTLADENDHALGRGTGDSLREAIEAAHSGEVIHFSPQLLAQVVVPFGTPRNASPRPTIFLNGTQIIIDKNLTIDASALPDSIQIHAGGKSRVFTVSSGITVVLKRLTLVGGSSALGGGISNIGMLSLLNCVVTGNTSTDFGGGVYNANGGNLTTQGTKFSGNSASAGGGIYNVNGGSLNIDLSTFSENTASEGGGIHHKGESGGTFAVRRSTFSQNAATSKGGGVFITGGPALVENSTLAGNTSGGDQGAGIYNQGSASLAIRHCTIAANIGAGIFNNAPATLTLDNTIVANNLKILNIPFDLQGDYTAVGANLVRIHTGTRLGGPAPLTADPILGPLASYGGASPTMPPLVGSPVIDAGVVTANTPSTDQQSSFRPNGPAPDIGSIESRLSGNTDLTWLTTSAGTLSPTFRSTLTSYTATVPHTVTTAAVRAASAQFGQTIQVRVNGGAFSDLESHASAAALPLNPGENPVEVKVLAQNGTTTKTYTVTVIRGAPSANNVNLVSLTTTSGSLSPAFDPGVTSYSTSVSGTTPSTTVTATTANPQASIAVRANFGAFTPVVSGAASLPLALNVGANAIDVRVTAQDGVAASLYTITVTREAPTISNANLASLSTSGGTLSPSFSRGVSFYTANVFDAVTSATVTASVVQAGATIALRANGSAFITVASGAVSTPLTLNGGANLIEVKVTAQDGTTVKSYTILVTRIVGGIERVSQRRLAPPAAGNDQSFNPSVSSDGRYVAFSSRASNLVANDSNNTEDIFVFDRALLMVERVSVNNGGQQATYNGSGGGNAESKNPSISADGRFVAFQSRADNLVPNDTNGQNDSSRGQDIFVHDRATKTIERISVRDTGSDSNGSSSDPSISGDGRYVAFSSGANNLVTGYANGENNVYVYDRTTRGLVGVSVPLGSFVANKNSFNPVISRDGHFVAFEFAVDKSVDSTPEYTYRDIYLYNRATRAVERITGAKIGPEADRAVSRSPSISADGRYVAFQSNLEYLDFYDFNSVVDVFVYDRIDGVTSLVSVDRVGTNEGFYESINPSISGDGRFVAFQSRSDKLATPNPDGTDRILRKDLATGELSVLSVGSSGASADGDSSFPSVSFDVRNVAFESRATNLGSPDTNQASDVFLAFTEALAPSALADLASLTSNLGAFSPGFSSGVTSYGVSVSDLMDTALVRPVAFDSSATLEARVNSSPFTALSSGAIAALPLDLGANSIDVKVTASNGTTTKTYSVMVTRVPAASAFSSNADLASLVPSGGSLSPSLASNTAVYSVVVPNSTTSVTLRPTTAQSNASVTVNGTPVAAGAASGSVSLSVGSNTIIVTVKAQDGVTTRSYAVAVTREGDSNADLAGLVPSVGSLSPSFASGTTAYTVNLPGGTAFLNLTPTVAQAGAIVTINGEPVTSGAASSGIALNVGINTLSVVVIASDGISLKRYVLTATGAPQSNTAPVALPQTVQVVAGASVTINLTGSDADGNPLTYMVVAQPTKGTLSGLAPALTYRPTTAIATTDSFTFKVNDGIADSPAATVTINITAIPPPVGNYTIGLNFGQGTAPELLAATETAGVPVVAQARWNNLTPQTGASTTAIVAVANGIAQTTSVKVAWSSANLWSSTGRGEENNPFTGADKKLLAGYLDTGNASVSQVTITSIPAAFIGQRYDVYVYALGGVAGRGGAYRIIDSLNGTVLTAWVRTQSPRNIASYVEVPVGGAVNQWGMGNYIVFRDLASPNITVVGQTSGGLGFSATPRAPINAIQLVAAARTAISISRVNGQITIHFTGTLQSANQVTGPFTPVSEATTPYTVTPDITAKFYIVR